MNQVSDAARAQLALEIQTRHASAAAGELGCVRSDFKLLAQVLRELMANGLKFNASPAPDIRVSAKPDAGVILYSVADNGIGIPADRADEVFKPLKRLNGFDYEREGMGLTIAKRIIEAHCGRIWSNRCRRVRT